MFYKFKILSLHGLPQSLCYECSALLQKYMKFRSKVIKSHNLLCQYVPKNIPVPYENKTPFLTRTSITCYEFYVAEVEQVSDQTIPDQDKQNINPAVDDTDEAFVIKTENIDVKVEVHFVDEDIAAEGSDVLVRAGAGLAIQRHTVDTTTEVNESEQIALKCGETKCRSDVNSAEELIEVFAYCDETDYSCDVILPNNDSPDEHVKNIIDSVTSNSRNNVQDQRDDNNSTILPHNDVHNGHFNNILNSVTSISRNNAQDQRDDSNSTILPHNDGNFNHIVNSVTTNTHNNVQDQIKDRSKAILSHSKTLLCDNIVTMDEHIKHIIKVKSVNSSSCDNLQLFICDICDKHFKKWRGILEHMRGHSGRKPYKCEICKEDFNKKDSFTKHCRMHIGDKPYTCVMCMKRFSQKSNLTTHYRVHSGLEPFKCNICSKSFTEKYSLSNHFRAHTGDKPYKCYVCLKSYSTNSNLNKHYRTHTRNKPYKCDVCLVGFSRKQRLYNHQKSHQRQTIQM